MLVSKNINIVQSFLKSYFELSIELFSFTSSFGLYDGVINKKDKNDTCGI